MQFGMLGWMGPGMRQVVGFGDRSMGGGNFGGKCGAPIVTNGEFAPKVCKPLVWRFVVMRGVSRGIDGKVACSHVTSQCSGQT